VIHFRDDLALGIGSLAQNVDDGLFVRAESLHGNSPEKFTYEDIPCISIRICNV
jgi:hypothetical protein